jgi:hypothetical protein
MIFQMEKHLTMLWENADPDTFTFWCHLMVLGPDQSKSQSFFSYWIDPDNSNLYIMIDFLACIRTMSLDLFYHESWKQKLLEIQTLLLYWFPTCRVMRTSHEFPPLAKGSKGILIPDNFLFKFMSRLWTSHEETMIEVLQKTKQLSTPPTYLTPSQMSIVTSNHWCKLFRSTHFKLSGREPPATLFGPMFCHITMSKNRVTHLDKPRTNLIPETNILPLKRKHMSVDVTSLPKTDYQPPKEPLVPIHLLHFPSNK